METKKKKTVAFAPVLEETQQIVSVVKFNRIEDLIFLMNPLYDNLYGVLPEYFESLGFKIITQGFVTLSEKQAKRLISRRYKHSSFKNDIIKHFTDRRTAYFHAATLNGNKVTDDLMRKYFPTWSDVLEYKLLEKPLKPESFPFIFVPMDSSQMYEDALKIISPDLTSFWGQDVYKFSKVKMIELMNTILIGTIGDGVKVDRSIKGTHMCKQLFYKPRESKSIHFMAHTPQQGRFEVRIQNKYGDNDPRKNEERRNRYLDKFHPLSMYYTRLKEVTDDCCPSFYRFRVCPDSNSRLDRVYEVEEFPGELFIHEVFRDAQNHRKCEVTSDSEASTKYSSKQGSLPSYAYGFKLAKLAETVQKVTFNDIQDVGKIKFDRGEFVGSVEMKDFYEEEQRYFNDLLDSVLPMIKSHISDFEKEKVDDFIEMFEDVINSHTFKESRRAHRIRLVPDRLDSINLRVYHKSEFVTDKFLRDLEKKLNIQIESLVREKYFQGMGKGLDSTILDRYERMKKDNEDEYRTTQEQLDDATETYKLKKKETPKKLGNYLEKDKEKIRELNKNDRGDNIKKITKGWESTMTLESRASPQKTKNYDTMKSYGTMKSYDTMKSYGTMKSYDTMKSWDSRKSLDSDRSYEIRKTEDFESITEESSVLDENKQEIVDKKGVAITSIKPAKYTKEHAAASIFYFINFYLPVIKRDEVLETNILENPQDFDEVVRGLTEGFEKNYEHFETGHKKPEFLEEDNDLEHHFKSNKKLKQKEIKKLEEERDHKRFLRCSCSPEEALELVAHDMREKQEERREVIRQGYVIRDDAMDIEDFYKNDFKNKYLKVAEHGLKEKTNLGPLLKGEVEEVMVKYQDQVVFNDKISFFRMEYFLYCIRELSYLKKDRQEFKEDLKYYERKMNDIDAKIQKLKSQNRGSAQKSERSDKIDQMQKDYDKYFRRIKEVDQDLAKKKRVIASLIDHILKWRIKAKRVYQKDHYGVPLSTYWRPLRFNDHVETDYDKEKYRMNLVEKAKKTIAHENMIFSKEENLNREVEDETEEAKFKRTMLGYCGQKDDQEELIFKKLVPMTEKISDEILNVVPEVRRTTLKNI